MIVLLGEKKLRQISYTCCGEFEWQAEIFGLFQIRMFTTKIFLTNAKKIAIGL